jgi:two-component system, cell cycle response regulator DivK
MAQPSHRILVVDDHDDTREMISAFVRLSGHDVIQASDGREGVERARQERPDLVLMDLSMPVFDGFEAATEIKQDHGISKIPILALSAYCWELSWREKALQCSCEACICKPVEFDTVQDLIARFCPGCPSH